MSLGIFMHSFSQLNQTSDTNGYNTGFAVTAVYSLLYELGLTADCTSFFHTSFSVLLTAENPKRLLLITEWLYPEVAKHYETTVGAVEHNIRTIVRYTWQLNREALERIAGYSLKNRPTPSQFIAILYIYLQSRKAA